MVKKQLLVGAFFLIIVVVMAVALTKKATVAPEPKNEPILVLPAPTIHFQSPKNVTFVFDREPVIPSQLPSYLHEDRSSAEIESVIKNTLPLYGIPASSSSLLRSNVSTKTWSRYGAEFTLTSTTNTTSVLFRQQQALTLPETTSPSVAVARQFFFQLFPLPSGVSLTNIGAQTDDFDGLFIVDTFPRTEFVAELFSYTLDGRPIVSLSQTGAAATIVVDGNSIIRAATIFPPPKSVVAATTVQLIPKDDILINLSLGNGSVVAAFNEATAGLGEQLTYTSFRIRETSVVYAKQGSLLLPAYLLSGVGTDNTGLSQEATYFLWAFVPPKQETTQP